MMVSVFLLLLTLTRKEAEISSPAQVTLIILWSPRHIVKQTLEASLNSDCLETVCVNLDKSENTEKLDCWSLHLAAPYS